MLRSTPIQHTSPLYRLGALALLTAVAAILVALGFEYIGGYLPCPLCLTERYAYYTAIPVLFFALIAASGGHPGLAALGFLLVSLAFLVNAGLGGYHAGAEWGFWPGPSTCSGALTPLDTTGGLLKNLANTHVVRCDQASWRLFGLSFAGWNAVISALLWITSFQAARAAMAVRSASSARAFI